MPFVDANQIAGLQNNVSFIRDICILAHVDHGKTTLADSLIASNGIISQRLAGKLRYLDNRPDEQTRGITMKSSSISLLYRSINESEYLINLIDSPGHVDFSSEVSTAVRLCDGAIVVVDVLEGVCPQTRTCLQQIYSEQLKPVLLLNKIDRLILEKKMDPLDAYVHLMQVLEQVNAAIGNIFVTDILAKEDLTETNNYISPLETCDDSTLYFSPEAGNVVFCSAVDGWAFSIKDFATMYSHRLQIPSSELEHVLWGDFYYNSKKKTYCPGAQEKAKKPMFVQFILENIWNLYEIIVIRKDKEKLPFVAEKLGIKLTPRDLRLGDTRAQLKVFFDRWLPIDRAVLEMVVKNVPAPNSVVDERVESLLCPINCDFSTFPPETKILKEVFKKCDPNSEVVIAFVSKMISVDAENLPENKPKRLTEQEIQDRRDIVRQRILERKKLIEEGSDADDVSQITVGMQNLSSTDVKKEDVEEVIEEQPTQKFIAFARVFSGTLRKGMKLFVLSPKHDPRAENISSTNSSHISEVEIGELYLFMGGELEILHEVPAGNIVGIGGLENHVLKTGTLSNTIHCPSFSELNVTATPILRVAVEPANPLEMPKLVKGLKLLNQADACVQVLIQETGEHVITTLGEVHLEKCVKDLEESFAKIALNVSKPIVSFRETIVPEATVDMVNEAIINSNKDIAKKIVTVQTSNKLGTIKILALPLPQSIVNILEKCTNILKALSNIGKNKFPEKQLNLLNQLKISLSKAFDEFDIKNISKQKPNIDNIWSIGPRKCGTNILLNLSDYIHPNFWDINDEVSKCDFEVIDNRRDFNSSFINGFQLATIAGPLCEEPMQGVCFLILEWTVVVEEELNSKVFGPFSGQVLSAVKEGCKKAFQNQPQRLVSPMYSCTIVVNADVLGKMYAVIGRRHGKVLSGDLTQGSGNFSVTAILPVIESFNFAQEIRKQTSGLACPQLVFSHWEIIDIDPFWVPSTEEEYTHFGEKADSGNRAKIYMDSVRKRKGLFVEEKTVEHAEKQRTLSKKK